MKTTPGAPCSIENEIYLLELLERHGLITAKQRDQITKKKNLEDQNSMKLSRLKKLGSNQPTPDKPDLIDIIASLRFQTRENPPRQLDDELIMRLVARDQKLPFKKLDPLELDLKTVTKSIPKSFALKHLLLPFEIKEGVLSVAIYDPKNQALLQEVEQVNQITVAPCLSTKADIKKILAEFFGFQTSITAAESHLARPSVDLENLEQYVKISSVGEIASTDQHIKGAVDHLFSYAFDQNASDIHVEPKRDCSMIRLRIDGILHTVYTLPKVVHPAMISRIKSLSRLNIAEKRRPQDGRIKINRGGEEAEIRVSTVPVAFGEKAVMRILDPTVLFQDLQAIGFSKRDYQVYSGLIEAPHGIILVTGPTGSGKSTTLYSTLRSIATPEKNITTVEDPVEMIHDDFNQISVQPSVDVTFSTILRNILRQDPDILMIGEIRDQDTATNAIQAALTGHLVLSTLHTNDAVTAISRLLDLGLQPFLVASTLLGAMAQRLVRKICPHCVESYAESTTLLHASGFPVPDGKTIELKRGKGCQQCRNTGYLGRCGIFEIFPMSEKIKQLAIDRVPTSDIHRVAVQEGMTTLKQDSWQKVIQGITTQEEALRVAGAN